MNATPSSLLSLKRNMEFMDTRLYEIYLPCSDWRAIPAAPRISNGDWTSLGQHVRFPELCVISGESHLNSKKKKKKKPAINAGEGVEKREFSYTVHGNAN